ncbi:transglycosylase SLT domain-containing protein [Pedobacter sp. SD-b]|uniref:Transglycosylase SLT domain-containing protein n=1 Tax=Pedobacter segetis TaxID=2793069 RepID=A0ABS1BK48_9SPHI|nr:lytic transglycosylase domain-containing protein [Pedobacter segetis]MBK0382706.1 transglycosylase SLT domain-containing protein [Pedobacter segetis]
MRKIVVLTTSFIFLINLSTFAFKSDTLKKIKLNAKEARLIKQLIKTDTLFDPANVNLQLELFKYNPNLVYKYRLDSLHASIPLDYNSYVQTYIDIFLSKRKEEVGHMVNLGKYYFPIFEKALAAYQVPSEFKYLPIIESSMNPMAVSRVGATGMWQFMYTTGRVYGLNIDNYVDERKDPIAASYAAAAYLRDAYNELGDWLLALASYNCGKGNVTRAIEKAGGSRNFWEIQGYLPSETRNYVPAFIAANYIMNYYSRHPQIMINDDDNILKTDSIYINKYISFDNIASALNLDEKDIQNLNPSYKKQLINGTKESPKRLVIPKLTYNDYTHFFDALNADEDQSIKVIDAIQKPTKPFKTITHIVQKGENLNKIADSYDVEVQDIKVWNNLPNYTIAIGQKLVVNKPVDEVKQPIKKKPSYIAYKVKAGDTLSAIAERFENTTIERIKEWNGLKSSILTIGAILRIKL